MIWSSFSRVGWFDVGYDVHAVQSFFADVERTLRGQLADPADAVTPKAAEDVLFAYKRNGYEVTAVDAAIDEVIEQLRHAERRRAAQHENSTGSDVDAATLPGAAPTTASSEYADFGTPEAVEQILRSMTQEKEQS